MLVALLVGAGIVIVSCGPELPEAQWDITCEDDLLRKLETRDKKFERYETAYSIVYWHGRMIDEAIVEKDYSLVKTDGLKLADLTKQNMI